MLDLFLPWLADVYTPFLAITCALGLIHLWRNKQGGFFRQLSGLLLLGIGLTYGVMLLDGYWRWWPRFGLDYSTHTALAFCLQRVNMRLFVRWRTTTWAVYFSYLYLMWYLDYHTVMDMLTTMLVVGVLLQLGAVCKIVNGGCDQSSSEK
ncbi:hypothetical protein ACVFI8_08730 [Agarivorans sp. MS3-6]